MADTTPLTPTDAELWQLHMQMPGRHKDPIDYARAVLARWGQPAHSGEPVAFAFQYDDGTWHDPSITEHSSGMRPLLEAPWPVAQELVAWKHDCAALLTNDVELWIDACPHCGKPRNAPQPVEREPPETCEWTATDAFDQTHWDSACGEAWTFIDGGPADNSVRFCQGCGKPVHIKQGGQHGAE